MGTGTGMLRAVPSVVSSRRASVRLPSVSQANITGTFLRPLAIRTAWHFFTARTVVARSSWTDLSQTLGRSDWYLGRD